MWTCPRCNINNRETSSVCDGCGAVRSAGRFASAPPVKQPMRQQETPRVSRADQPSAPQVTPFVEQAEAPARPRRAFGAIFVRAVGHLLCVLLPLLVIALSWRQYNVLHGWLIPLFLEPETPDVYQMILYIVLTFTACLLALVPGLTLLTRKGHTLKD